MKGCLRFGADRSEAGSYRRPQRLDRVQVTWLIPERLNEKRVVLILEHQRFLRGEVPEKSARGDLACFRDLFDRRRMVALFAEQPQSLLLQRRERLLLLFLAKSELRG